MSKLTVILLVVLAFGTLLASYAEIKLSLGTGPDTIHLNSADNSPGAVTMVSTVLPSSADIIAARPHRPQRDFSLQFTDYHRQIQAAGRGSSSTDKSNDFRLLQYVKSRLADVISLSGRLSSTLPPNLVLLL